MKIVEVVIEKWNEGTSPEEPFDEERFSITAEAKVICDHGFTDTIETGGTSDVYSSTVAEVEQEQLAELRSKLLDKGFSSRAITAAINQMKINRVLEALDGRGQVPSALVDE